MVKYLKGSLHNHTTCSDGQASPEEAAKIYKSLGYDFIIYTDHDTNFPVEEYIKEPMEDFTYISGAEFGFRFKNHFNNNADVHLCGIGYVGDYIPPRESSFAYETISQIIREYYRLGAIPQVNHPNWGGSRRGYSFNYTELLNVNYPYLLEIVNYSDGGHNEGNEAFESVEYIWDVLLSNGKTVYGTMTDDTHIYFGKKPWIENSFSDIVDQWANDAREILRKGHTPGNGFVMVKVDTDNNLKDNILSSLRCGDFYASNGLYADFYEVRVKYIKIKVKPQNGENNRIIFKGRMGLPLKIVDGDEAVYEFTGSPDEQYIRVKAINGAGKCALFQPVFNDGRNKLLINK